MSQKYKLVEVSGAGPSSGTAVQVTDWKLCCLCQSQEQENMVYPCRNKNPHISQETYNSMAERLIEFERYDSLPFKINLTRLNEGFGITNTLIATSAIYHRACYLKISNQELKRAKRRKTTDDNILSPMRTRRSLDASSKGTKENPTCLICEETGGTLHYASTDNID